MFGCSMLSARLGCNGVEEISAQRWNKSPKPWPSIIFPKERYLRLDNGVDNEFLKMY